MTMLVKALLAYVLASDQLEPNELEVSVHLQPLEELALVFSISCFRHPPDHHTTTNSYCLWYMRSCFLYPALSSNSSLSLWGSPSSNGLTRGTQRPSPPPHPSFQSKPTNTISPPTPFFHPCCPNPQWYLLKPEVSVVFTMMQFCKDTATCAVNLELHTLHTSKASSVLASSLNLQRHDILQNEGSCSTQTDWRSFPSNWVFKTQCLKGHRFMCWYRKKGKKKKKHLIWISSYIRFPTMNSVPRSSQQIHVHKFLHLCRAIEASKVLQ